MRGFFVVFACVFFVLCHGQQEAKKEFSIRPSRDDSVSVEIAGGIKCSFSWQDCTGGSSELWEIALKKTNKGASCSVGRPRDSYLTFTTWAAQLDAKGLVDADVAAFTGTGGEMLRDTDFKVAHDAAGKVVVSNAHTKRHSVQGVQILAVISNK